MAITSTLSRIFSTLAAMASTRLELISVELEEELLRFSSYFFYTLIALFCGGVAISLILLLIIILFWDDHRIAVLVSMIAIFGATSFFIAIRLKTQILNKPRLLEHSLAELKRDAKLLFPDEQNTEQQNQPSGREL